MTAHLPLQRTLVFLLLLSFCACRRLPPDQAIYLKGYKAYEKGEYEVAAVYLRPLVENGHPASQLLMSKMYTRGLGVKQDTGKAELLKSLAALRLASRGFSTDQRKLASTLAKGLIALPEDPDAQPGEQDVATRALTTLNPADLDKLALELQKSLPESLDGGELPSTGLSSGGIFPTPESTPAPTPATPVKTASPREAPKESPHVIPVDAHKVNGLSLGFLLRSADQGDPLAMQLLSRAYAEGFYGLPVNADKASHWAKRAVEAHALRRTHEEIDVEDRFPWARLIMVCVIGLFLIGLGIWQARRVRVLRP
jgi:hypothetical protein